MTGDPSPIEGYSGRRYLLIDGEGEYGDPRHIQVVYWALHDDLDEPLGPFDYDLAAWNALRLSGRQVSLHTAHRVHYPGAYVWPRLKGDPP